MCLKPNSDLGGHDRPLSSGWRCWSAADKHFHCKGECLDNHHIKAYYSDPALLCLRRFEIRGEDEADRGDLRLMKKKVTFNCLFLLCRALKKFIKKVYLCVSTLVVCVSYWGIIFLSNLMDLFYWSLQRSWVKVWIHWFIGHSTVQPLNMPSKFDDCFLTEANWNKISSKGAFLRNCRQIAAQ